MVSKKRSSSSRNWLKQHHTDGYVRKAKYNGLRSRAWFKLKEIQEVDRVFKPGMFVLDLGAAPGGWSHYAIQKVGLSGRVIACDMRSMNSIAGVDFVKGDFFEKEVQEALVKKLGNQKVQIIISDMALNSSGIPLIDISKSICLVESVLEMCSDILMFGGNFVVKAFYGDGFDEYFEKVRSLFEKTIIRKPFSSRSCSREVYIVAKGRKQ